MILGSSWPETTTTGSRGWRVLSCSRPSKPCTPGILRSSSARSNGVGLLEDLQRFGHRARLHRVGVGIGHLDGAVQRLAEQRMIVDDEKPRGLGWRGHAFVLTSTAVLSPPLLASRVGPPHGFPVASRIPKQPYGDYWQIVQRKPVLRRIGPARRAAVGTSDVADGHPHGAVGQPLRRPVARRAPLKAAGHRHSGHTKFSLEVKMGRRLASSLRAGLSKQNKYIDLPAGGARRILAAHGEMG